MLQGVQRLVAHGRLVQAMVPGEQVERPQRQRAGPGGPARAGAVEGLAGAAPAPARAGQAEHEQQRADVGDQQVLGHVEPNSSSARPPSAVSAATPTSSPA